MEKEKSPLLSVLERLVDQKISIRDRRGFHLARCETVTSVAPGETDKTVIIYFEAGPNDTQPPFVEFALNKGMKISKPKIKPKTYS